ncbi:hypothetical protein C0J52_12351 [Blattella germanica]|nr:hypothetical protein C0J52_12351 [Blattella germanica]
MKVFVALAFLATLGLLAEAGYKDWRSPNIGMPVNPKYTAQEWRDIYAAQVELPTKPAVVEGAQPQPAFAGKVHVADNHHRITNGQTASRGQFPWQAALIVNQASFCGGSIIAPNYVLTAAHCANAVILTTRNSVVHSNYDSETINNDIALVILPQSVDYTSSTSISSTLQYVDLSVITNNECANTYGSVITSTKLCVRTSGGQSTCNGDSGGPLVIQQSDGQYTLVGIVSFGSIYGCQQGYPAAFTRAEAGYKDWRSPNIGMPVNPKYTAQEWRDIYAAQVELPTKPAVVEGAQPQPGSTSISSTLQYVDLSVITNNECANTYGNIITSTKLCVRTSGGQSTCNGDSGGPLVIQQSDGQYTLVGIVSFGSIYGCQQGYPAAFTRVSSYLDWISSNSRISVQ